MKKEHEEILKRLKDLCKKYPEQRFGQILFNYTAIGCGHDSTTRTVEDPFHYEDEAFLRSIHNVLGRGG